MKNKDKTNYVVIGVGASEAIKAVMVVLLPLDPISIIRVFSQEETPINTPEPAPLIERHIIVEHLQTMRDIGVLSFHEIPSFNIEPAILDTKVETLIFKENDFTETKLVIEKPSVNPATRQSKYKKKYSKHRR